MEQARRKIATEADGWAKENARCAADIFHWIDNWVWQYDPRLVGQYDDAGQPIPTYFKPTLWEEQREFVDWFRERIARQEEGLSDKSRDTGVTYLCLMCCLHAWRYTDGFKATFGSRTEDCVDKVGNPDSIFEKLRVIVDRMPDEMLPPSFERRRHSSYMKLINPNNGSSIVGEGGPNMGRSGRSSVFVADEAAHMPEADKVARALSGNTDCVIWVSSVEGMDNLFARKRHNILRPHQIKTMHWRNDPRKSEAWAAEKRRSIGDIAFASEYDIDYTASVSGIVIPGKWVVDAIDAHIKLGFADDGQWLAGFDVADEGPDINAMVARKGVILQYAEGWDARDTGVTARKAVVTANNWGVKRVQYDCVGVGATVKAEINRLNDEGLIPRGMRFIPWDAGAGVLFPERHVVPADIDSPTNKDHYRNLKAQAWWELRQRFERTYRAVGLQEDGLIWRDTYDPDELISIPSSLPNLDQIKVELSQATYSQSGQLKLLIDKKPDNAKSPNYADAIVMCYWPVQVGVLEISESLLARSRMPMRRRR